MLDSLKSTIANSLATSVELKSHWVAEYMGFPSGSWCNNGIYYKSIEDARSYNAMRAREENVDRIKRRVSKITLLVESYDE